MAPASLTATTSTSSGTIPAGTYYYVFTGSNSWGESLPSTEASFTLASPGQVTFAASGLTPGAAGGNVYVGTAPGQENGYVSFVGTGNVILSALSQLLANVPPTRATGMNPDSDGGFCTARELYRFLNDGLSHLGRIAGGILDHTGFQVISGTSMYRLGFSQWLRFLDAWCDGYLLEFCPKAFVNYQAPVQGIPRSFTV